MTTALMDPLGTPNLGWDAEAIRAKFPALHQEVNGHPLVYLDSAASALKPRSVIDAVVDVYSREPANVHRGVHTLSTRATQKFEGARETIRSFFNARHAEEVIFVRGATEGINLIAHSWARPNLKAGDEILLTGLEHHSNIVPWQEVCRATGAELRVAPVADDGGVPLSAIEQALTERTRLISVTAASNALGSVLDVAGVARLARGRGAVVVVDGAQAAPHLPVDVQSLDCDFFVASGHKMYGPTGIGVVIGRKHVLSGMPPYQTGGDMIRSVTFEKTEYASLPNRFEAGTPHVAGAVGLAEACRFLLAVGLDRIAEHEQQLLEYGSRVLRSIPGVHLVGTAANKIGVISFVVDGIHPHDLGTIADSVGVAIRTGHHCTQPVMERFGFAATARASLGIYSDYGDLDALAHAIRVAQEMFG